jgi:hypothetical protein
VLGLGRRNLLKFEAMVVTAPAIIVVSKDCIMNGSARPAMSLRR